MSARFPRLIDEHRRPRLPRRRHQEEMSVTDALRRVPADAPSFTPKPTAATGPQRALGTPRPPATDAARFTGPMTALRAPAAFVPGAEPPEDDPRGTDPYAGAPDPGEAVNVFRWRTTEPPSARTPTGPMQAVRVPGAALREKPRQWEPPLEEAELRRAIRGLVHMDEPDTRAPERRPAQDERLPIHDAAIAAHPVTAEAYGTGPQPVHAPDTAPVTEPGAGDGLVRALLLAQIWNLITWGSPDRDVCPACQASPSGWCDLCDDAADRTASLSVLFDLVLQCETDAEAYAAVRASGFSPADLAVNGSPLAAVLDGGAR